MGLMTPGRIYAGSTVRITGHFSDETDTDADPSVSIVFKTRSPCGVEASYTYGTDAEIQKESVGDYTADVRVTEGGRWLYRWEAQTDLGITVYVAGEGSIVVQASRFDGYSDNWNSDYAL